MQGCGGGEKIVEEGKKKTPGEVETGSLAQRKKYKVASLIVLVHAESRFGRKYCLSPKKIEVGSKG